MDNSEKRYLSPELSVKKMYQMYLEKYEHDFLERQSKGEKCKPKVKYDFYWQYFNKNFNYHLPPQSQTHVKHVTDYKIVNVEGTSPLQTVLPLVSTSFINNKQENQII